MSDLDLPLLPSAEQIRKRRFATVRRGFDPDQVQDYLNQVAIQVETLETELRDERMGASSRPATEAPAPPAPKAAFVAPPVAAASAEAAYEQLSQRFASVLRAADEESQALIANAKAEARKIMEEAQAEADKIRVDAQANAEAARTASAAALEKARIEADRVVGGLEQRREAMLEQMHEMQSRLLAVAQNLDVPEIEPAGGGAHAAPPTATAAKLAGAAVRQAPSASPAVNTPPASAAPPSTHAAQAEEPPPAPAKEATPAPIGQAAGSDADAVDPRYEDLWASTENKPVDIPDLSSLDIDFDDDEDEDRE